ncbi:MAG: RNA polymerase sigma factor [Myxococcales bacterium]
MAAAALTCPELLDQCVAGDRSAWRALHAAYRPQAVSFLLRLGVRPREADDACQDIFLQVFRYLHRFERRADFRTWLYKLCISQAARVRRRALLARSFRWISGAPADTVATPDFSAARSSALVDGALASLTGRQREVFVLFEFEQLPTAEIARLVGAPPASVRRQLQEARQKFERFVHEQPLQRGLSK